MTPDPLFFLVDCASFANTNFHQGFLVGSAIAINCPTSTLFMPMSKNCVNYSNSESQVIEVALMEALCCFGLAHGSSANHETIRERNAVHGSDNKYKG